LPVGAPFLVAFRWASGWSSSKIGPDVSTTSDQRSEEEPDDQGAAAARAWLDGSGPPRVPDFGPPPKIAEPRFPATLIDLEPPVHEPDPRPFEVEPATIALPHGAPPRIAEPRFPATIIDFNPPTEMQHEIEAAPETTRKPSVAPPSPETEMTPLDPARALHLLPGVPATTTIKQKIESAPWSAPASEAPMPEASRTPPATPIPGAGARASKSDSRFFSRDDLGRFLDRYELITEIASGGMATVFLARLQGAGGFQRLVAIKRLHTELAMQPEFVEMFLEEARIAAQIHHTHAVPILEIGSSARGYYLVMEYIEGVTLAQIAHRVAQSGLQVPRKISLRMILDALAGLHAAHELADESGEPLGVVHRDVSPQNILIGVDGAARITDFGVARTTAQVSDTKLGTLKGKVAYMAPEQIRQEPIDRRADLFAMGVVLWEVLAGRPLFRADTKFDTIVRALNAPVPLLRDTVFGISDALDELSAKALARPPGERFQSAVEMAEAIEQVAKGSIATSREVATFMVKLFSRELNDRRAGIRSWLEEVPVATLPAAEMPHVIHAASVVARPSEEEIAADMQAAPESVTVPRQFVGSLAPIPFEGEEPVELPMGGPMRSMGRQLIAGAVIVAVVAIVVFSALRRGMMGVSAGARATASASASASASALASATTFTSTSTTATATAVTLVEPGVSATAVAVAAPVASVHAAATSSAKAVGSSAPSQDGAGELENPYR
jgi:eukaryotic-like serine/threonine-protein kinase